MTENCPTNEHVTKEEFDGYAKRTDKRLDVLDTAVFGDKENDKPGITESIRNINNALSILVRLAWIVTTVLVTALLSGIITAAFYLIRIMPAR